MLKLSDVKEGGTELVDEGVLSVSEAEAAGRRVLSGNARELYPLT